MATLQLNSEQQLIQQAKQGNSAAWNALYEKFFPLVYRRVYLAVPPQDVEDVVQEVFLAVIRSLGSYRGESQFKTWLWTLAERQIANFYRHRSAASEPIDEESDDELHTSQDDPGTPSEDDLRSLHEAVNHLPERYQDVLLRRFVGEYKFHEIAQLNGESLEATKSLFRRAVMALRKTLETKNER